MLVGFTVFRHFLSVQVDQSPADDWQIGYFAAITEDSVETWLGHELVGGVYGVAVGGLFAAESMFHLHRDAGMVAFVTLTQRLLDRGFTLFDTQMATDHTRMLGAVDIPRSEYQLRLDEALNVAADFA